MTRHEIIGGGQPPFSGIATNSIPTIGAITGSIYVGIYTHSKGVLDEQRDIFRYRGTVQEVVRRARWAVLQFGLQTRVRAIERPAPRPRCHSGGVRDSLSKDGSTAGPGRVSGLAAPPGRHSLQSYAASKESDNGPAGSDRESAFRRAGPRTTADRQRPPAPNSRANCGASGPRARSHSPVLHRRLLTTAGRGRHRSAGPNRQEPAVLFPTATAPKFGRGDVCRPTVRPRGTDLVGHRIHGVSRRPRTFRSMAFASPLRKKCTNSKLNEAGSK